MRIVEMSILSIIEMFISSIMGKICLENLIFSIVMAVFLIIKEILFKKSICIILMLLIMKKICLD